MARKWHIIYMNNPKSSLGFIHTAFQHRGIDVVLWQPMQEVIKQSKNEVSISKSRPLFQSYVFALFENPGNNIVDNELKEQMAGYLLREVGAQEPATITDETIQYLRGLEKLKITPASDMPDVEVGSFIEITNGPFINMRGLVSAIHKDTVDIETFVFGRSVSVEISKSSIRKITQNLESSESNDEIEGAVHEKKA